MLRQIFRQISRRTPKKTHRFRLKHSIRSESKLTSSEVNSHYSKVVSLAKIYRSNIVLSAKPTAPNHHDFYTGENCCGIMSLLLSYVLKKNNPKLNLQTGYVSHGYGEYMEDHTFILCVPSTNDSIQIIDPTYKQFFQSTFQRYARADNAYDQFLYRTLPKFFVGDLTDMRKLIDKMIEIEHKTFGENSLNKTQLLKWWDFEEVAPFDMNLYEVVHQNISLQSVPQFRGLANVIMHLRDQDQKQNL